MMILLISDTSTNPNLGCQANTAAMYQTILKYKPKASVDCVTLKTLLGGKPIRSCEMAYHEGQKADHNPLDLKMASYDTVIVNGEGSIGQQGPQKLGAVARNIFLLIEWAHKADVPTHMVNFTHNIKSKLNNKQAKNAYARCASVSVREPISFQKVQSLYPAVKLFPDLTCIHKKVDRRRKNIIMVGGGTCLKIASKQEAFQGYKRILKRIKRYDDYQAILVGWPSLLKGDDEFFEEFIQKFKFPQVAYKKITDYKDYIELCSRSALNITGRHHGIVMSFLSGCPFLPIVAQNHKVGGDSILYSGEDKAVSLTSEYLERHIDSHIWRIEEMQTEIASRYDELEPYFDGHIRQIWLKETQGL